VRLWWILALFLLAVTGYLVGGQLIGAWRDRWLLQHGLHVNAEILEVDGLAVKNKLYGPELNLPFKMRVVLPDGREQIITDRLKAQKEALGPPMKIQLYVDPANPSHWTDRQKTTWSEDALVAVLLVPIGTAFLIAAVVQRVRVLRVWKMCPSIAAVVVETRQTAAAPLSRQVRFVLRDSKDHRVFSTTIPTRSGIPQPGDLLWLVAPANHPERALVAGLYQ
jgi:hypothetical protein